MTDMDDPGLNAPEQGAVLADIQPGATAACIDEGTESCTPLHRGNGGRPRKSASSLRRILEAVLFAADRPVSLDDLAVVVQERSREDLAKELEDLSRSYENEDRGFQLLATGSGYQITTHPEMHEHVTRFLVGKKRARLSRAAMETLAIVAYRQPITRGEVEQIRGVDCGHVLHTLLDRGLLTVKGRSQALGRPLLYGSTEEFLHYFGIRTLADLPSPEELRDLIGEDPLTDGEVRELMEVRGLADEAGSGADDPGQSSEPEDGESGPISLDPEERGEESAPSPDYAERSGGGYLYASN